MGSVLIAILLSADLLEGNFEWQCWRPVPFARWYQQEEEPLTTIMKGRGDVTKHSTDAELEIYELTAVVQSYCLCWCIYVIASSKTFRGSNYICMLLRTISALLCWLILFVVVTVLCASPEGAAWSCFLGWQDGSLQPLSQFIPWCSIRICQVSNTHLWL